MKNILVIGIAATFVTAVAGASAAQPGHVPVPDVVPVEVPVPDGVPPGMAPVPEEVPGILNPMAAAIVACTQATPGEAPALVACIHGVTPPGVDDEAISTCIAALPRPVVAQSVLSCVFQEFASVE